MRKVRNKYLACLDAILSLAIVLSYSAFIKGLIDFNSNSQVDCFGKHRNNKFWCLSLPERRNDL